jgi:hypothetical protein
MLKKRLLFLICCIVYLASEAQQPISETELLYRINNQQLIKNQSLIEGVLPSYICRTQTMHSDKINNNIFYNDLLIYTLKQLESSLADTNQHLCDSIISRAQTPFPKFENRKGRGTYNFWRTDSAYSFPYTWWVGLVHKKYAPPDDLDVTALSVMALSKDSTAASNIHQLMQDYTHSGKKSRSVERKYQSYHFYSSWFGNKFPVVLDVCVLANVLCMVQKNNLRWTKSDSASLNLIVTSITNNDIAQHPLRVSPYYGKSSIILYHLARLMSIRKINQLESVKPLLVKIAMEEYDKSSELLEKIIIASSLMKWGYDIPDLEMPNATQVERLIEKSNFPFFIGNVPSFLSHTKRTFLTKLKLGLFYHYCPAFNDALLLEYITLKKNRS